MNLSRPTAYTVLFLFLIWVNHTEIRAQAVNIYTSSNAPEREVHKIDAGGNQIWVYSGHTFSSVTAVAVNHEGFVYSGSVDTQVHKIDPDGNQVLIYTGHSGTVMSIAVDAEGFVYSGSTDKELHKIDPDGNQVWVYTGHEGNVNAVAVDPDGYVYTGSGFGGDEVHKIDPDGNMVWIYTGHSGTVNSVAVDTEGNVYSGSSDNQIHKIDSGGNQVWTYPAGFTVRSVYVGHTGEVFAGLGAQVRKLDNEGNHLWTFTGHSTNVNAVAGDHKGNIYSGSADERVHKIDADGNLVWTYNEHNESIRDIAVGVFDIVLPPSELSVHIENPTLFPRQTFTVDIHAGSDENPISDLFGLGFQLVFNPDQFSITGAEAGPFLNTDEDLIFFSEVEHDSSFVSVSVSRKQPAGGVDGFGSIARITFEVKDDITESLEIFDLQEVMAVNPSGIEIPIETQPDSVELVSFMVWPGDTNNDGVVDANDLLPIGQFFGFEGPAREDRSLNWEMKNAIPWDEVAATWADATGDGKINQNDVLPIGLNFDFTHDGNGVEKSGNSLLASDQNDLPAVEIPQAGAGQTFTLTLTLGSEDEPVDELLGISMRLSIPGDVLEILQIEEGGLFGEADLLSFAHFDEELAVQSAAFTRKRPDGPVAGFGEVMVIEFESPSGFSDPVEIRLLESAFSDLSEIRYNPLVTIGLSEVLSSGDPHADLPAEFTLGQNYPNPFNPATTIRYGLPEPSHVSLTVYNLLGQPVAVLVNEIRKANYHEAVFDASGLPSGMYIYRLQAGNHIKSGKLMLVK